MYIVLSDENGDVIYQGDAHYTSKAGHQLYVLADEKAEPPLHLELENNPDLIHLHTHHALDLDLILDKSTKKAHARVDSPYGVMEPDGELIEVTEFDNGLEFSYWLFDPEQIHRLRLERREA